MLKNIELLSKRFTPKRLYEHGGYGAWFDISDASTLSQLSGSYTAVAVGDPIGRIRDKSGNGNDATQSTSTARPLLDSIRNTVGVKNVGALRLKHDFVDDALKWNGATGDYWIAVANISGVQFYQGRLTQTTGNIPISDCVDMVVLNREFTAKEQSALTKYFSKKLTGIPLVNGYLFECNGSSYIGRGGSCSGNLSWAFGKGSSYSTMFTATESITARESLFFSFTKNLLSVFNCNTNQLTGSIPSLSANTALTQFYCYSNLLTGSIPSLSANTALNTFYCYSNQITGFSGGTVSNTLGDFRAQNNLLTQSAVDAILAAFDAAGRNSGTRTLNLGGTGNAAPSAAGLVSKSNLVAKGWTVTTN